MIGFAAREMDIKLTQKRKEGRGGWFRSECSETELIDMLHEHIQKGDMVDVLNLAAMILAKRELEEND